MPLERLIAGHLALKLIPDAWPAMTKDFRWRRLGPDGVLEFPLHCRLWAEQLLRARRRGQAPAPLHDRNVTEASFQLGELAFAFHNVLCAAAQASMQPAPCTSTTPTSFPPAPNVGQSVERCTAWARHLLQTRSTSRWRSRDGGWWCGWSDAWSGQSAGSCCLGKASRSSLASVSVPFYLLTCCLAIAGGVHDPIRGLASEMAGAHRLHRGDFEFPDLVPQSSWSEGRLCGGPDSVGHAGGPPEPGGRGPGAGCLPNASGTPPTPSPTLSACSAGPRTLGHECLHVSAGGAGRAQSRHDAGHGPQVPDHDEPGRAARHADARPGHHLVGGDEMEETGADPRVEELKLDGERVKAGQRQLISQAWDRRRRDQLLISCTSKQVKEVMVSEFYAERRRGMNEAFVMEIPMLDLHRHGASGQGCSDPRTHHGQHADIKHGGGTSRDEITDSVPSRSCGGNAHTSWSWLFLVDRGRLYSTCRPPVTVFRLCKLSLCLWCRLLPGWPESR